MQNRARLAAARRVVVKIGSSLLIDRGRGLDRPAIACWVAQMAELCRRGMRVVVVSSGSVAEGMVRLGWPVRPKALHELQAAAAVGQMGLVQTWESSFRQHGLHTAQILLTHDDLSNRQRYLNARSTLLTLIGLGAVPIINENDTVATDEIRFGDNDTLAALVANLIEADLLLILTDQEGLYDRDPSLHADARLIGDAGANDSLLDAMVGGSRSGLGRGGMVTKLRAARLAARSGAATVIVAGAHDAVLTRVVDGENLGTFLRPDIEPVDARKRWLLGHLQLRGRLTVDEGAVRALRQDGKSLLPIGVVEVHGRFERGELVACCDAGGREIARGLVNYGADEARRIARQPSARIEAILGYVDERELIHRDNLVLV